MNRKTKIQKLKDEVQIYQINIGKLQKKIYDLIVSCNHKYIRNNMSAKCKNCDLISGWWCTKSRDGLCYYTNSDDACDFCGEPEERK